jgi:hypothetical protein
VAIVQNPWYVNNDGQQTVVLQNGGWQVQWSRTSAHGFLVCSFVPTSNYQRNDDDDDDDSSRDKKKNDKDKDNDTDDTAKYSKLEKGVRFFIYHRIWTSATLASERARRRAIQITAAKALQERDVQLQQEYHYTSSSSSSSNERRRNDNTASGGTTADRNNKIAAVTSKIAAYAQAVKSMRDYRESGYKEALYIPLHESSSLATDAGLYCIVAGRSL